MRAYYILYLHHISVWKKHTLFHNTAVWYLRIGWYFLYWFGPPFFSCGPKYSPKPMLISQLKLTLAASLLPKWCF